MAPVDGHRSSSGRSATTASTTEHQYNASNNTVNKFLGGRKPSWMTASNSVKPTPRPPNRPPKESLPELPLTQTNNLSTGSSQQPSSLSSSSLYRQHQRRGRPAKTAHPPSLAAAASAPLQLLPRPPLAHKTTQRSVVTLPSAAVFSSPALSDRPSPPVAASLDISSPRGLPHVFEELTPPSVTLAHLDPVGIIGVTDVERDTNASASAQSSTATANQPETAATAIGGGLLPTTGTAATLKTPPTTTASTARSVTVDLPASGNREPPPKRRRIGTMAHGFLTSVKAVESITQQIHDSGGEDALGTEVERPRYQLLMSACREGDLFFVILHRIFCSWSYNNSSAHILCIENNQDPASIDIAFGLVGTILKSNSKLRSEHAQFFRNFPLSMETLYANVPLYAQTVSQVLMFLTRLSQAWMIVNNAHRQLGYPLLMDELLGTFGLFSPTLQTIVFRASRRTLSVADGEIGKAMDGLFAQDQAAHRQANGSFILIGTEPYHNAPSNQRLIQKYCEYVAQAQAQFQQYHQMHQQQQQNNLSRTTNPGLSTSHSSSATRLGNNAVMTPVIPSSGQGMQPQMNYQFNGSNSAEGNFVFNPSAVSRSYQMSAVQFSGHQNTTDMNPPTSNHYSKSASPTQSPIMNQGQYFQPSGRPQIQASGGAQPPPPVQNYSQQFQPRRTAQQFHIPSTQSPQIQNLVGVPQQGHSSTIQANTIQEQQAWTLGRSSPHFQQNAARISPQMRPPVELSQSQNALPTPATSPPEPGVNLQALPAPQQQSLPGQQMMQMNQIRQSSIRSQYPSQGQAQRGDTNSAAALSYRRTPSTQIPLTQHPHDPQDRKSLEISLHQAHIRSPRRLLNGFGFSSPPERYYQSIKYLALQPVPIPQQKYLHVFTFEVPQKDYENISKDGSPSGLSMSANLYFNGSMRFRLRVCLPRTVPRTVPEEEWVALDTCWPEHIHMQLNQQPVLLRRKQHHAKDQPAEIGMFVKPGENVLKVSIPVQRPFEDNQLAFIAVEAIETLSHTSIYALPNLGADAIISPRQTQSVIQKRLGGLSTSDDDEIAMVSKDLSINLADPFSYSLWTIPARGKDCTHLECFDLETWLSTRPGKKSCSCGAKRSADCKHCPKEPSLVDKWKCPLCQGDARPYSLRIDGFLCQVRQALAKDDLLRVKEIKVTADGTWNPVKPDDDDDDDDFDSDEEARPDGTARRPSAAKSASDPLQRNRALVEVICLDDD